MPKNKGAGGKNRRKGKGSEFKRELIFKSDGQEYGQITKSVGNGFMEIMCFSSTGNVLRRAHIRGSMRKRVWMTLGDIVLVSTRDFQDNTCDIVLKYTSDEARILKNRKEIPETIEINKKDMVAEEPTVTFDDNNDENDDDENDNAPGRKVSAQQRNLDLPPNDSDDDINLDDI